MYTQPKSGKDLNPLRHINNKNEIMKNNNRNVTRIEKSYKFEMTWGFFAGAAILIKLAWDGACDYIRTKAEIKSKKDKEKE